jgi:hypothetical protein
MRDNPFITLTPEAIHLRIVDQMAFLSKGTFNDVFLGMDHFVPGMVLF